MATSIILLIISLGFLIFGSINYSNFTKIVKTGVTTEGIIFIGGNYSFNEMGTSYPTVRFLTADNEWITEISKTGLFIGYTKKDEKVTVIYNPDNPKEFVIKSNYTKLVLAIIIASGIVLLIAGIILLFI